VPSAAAASWLAEIGRKKYTLFSYIHFFLKKKLAVPSTAATSWLAEFSKVSASVHLPDEDSRV
jgi:hypothetical protein